MAIRSVRILSAFAALTLVSGLAAADPAPARWEFAGWYGGGCYPDVVFDPRVKGRLYLASDVAGIWRSDDSGEKWDFVTRGLGSPKVFLLTIAPSDSNVIYAGTSAGVFYSQNAGENWQASESLEGRLRFKRPDNHRSLVVSQTAPSEVIAGTSKGEIFHSLDFGKKWAQLGDRRPFGKNSAITAIIWLEKENILYASSDQGLARYSFQQAQWTYFRDSPKDISDLWVDPLSSKTILAAGQNKTFISQDGGDTWKSGSVIPKGVLYRLLAVGEGGKTFLAAWNDGWKGGVVRSEDAGEHWKPWDKEMEPDAVLDPSRAWAGVHGRITALKADPFDPQVVFRTDWWGVWKSEDGGVRWKEKIAGSPNTVVMDVAVSEKGEIYAASMDNGLMKSGDGGKTYQALYPDKGYDDQVNGHVWRVLLHGDRVIATSSAWGVPYDQVITSSDGGKTFQRSHEGLPSQYSKKNTVWHRSYARALAGHPSEPDTVYLGIDGDDGGGFFISKDGGRVWKRSQGQPGSLRIYNALAVDPSNPKGLLWGASGKSGGIYLSEDGGESWRRAGGTRMSVVFDLSFGAGGKAYAGGSIDGAPAVFFSEDSGRNWQVLKRFDPAGVVKGLCVLPDGRVAVGITPARGDGGGRLYLSSPDGKQWDNIWGDLPEGTPATSLTFDKKNDTIYLSRYAGCVYKMKVPSIEN